MKFLVKTMLTAALAIPLTLSLAAQDKKSTKPAEPAQASDPVCGMTVDTKTAEKSAYKGKTYYFCSPDDKKDFEKDPTKYVKADKPADKKKT
jgi:YHS domain-containing protein